MESVMIEKSSPRRIAYTTSTYEAMRTRTPQGRSSLIVGAGHVVHKRI